MIRTTIWTLILPLALGSAAMAAPTNEAKCQGAKLQALRKRTFCIEGERRKEVLGKTSDTAKCEEKFAAAITKSDEAAAKKGTSCHWLENGDGTATDLNSGLQWELKTDDGSVHDKDNTYTWTTTSGGTTPNGTAFTVFLGTLNGGVADPAGGLTTITTTGCFAGKCDWRLPTIGELLGILDARYPHCTINPCTTIPGFTAGASPSSPGAFYWSLSTFSGIPGFSEQVAWVVDFYAGIVPSGNVKTYGNLVRAVRGGS